ncbi:MAG TPA: beta-ketoacyl-[acyl-carrier-protein] synthase II [Anaerolineae bacterium]|nr:beta-ketoacyl-[acyl-carrier-protein] synthase II [Anaerolineae bacterium]
MERSTNPGGQRVVITGLGAVTPLGLSAQETWAGLLAGRSGVHRITSMDLSDSPSQIGAELKGFDPVAYLGFKAARRMARFSQMAVVAARMAVEDAGLDLDDAEAEEAAVLLGTAVGGTGTEGDTLDRHIASQGLIRVSPLHFLSLPASMAAFHIAQDAGFRGYNATLVTACASGTQAIGEAFELLRRGRAQVALAGGSEAILTPLAFAGFAALRALSTRNDDPPAASRPFDAKRDGFVLAEGAALLVLETLEHARRRGARIYAEISGHAANSEGYHAIAPSPEAGGPIKAMRQALADAGLGPEQVDYINAHGASTLLGDAAETRAIKAVLGARAYRVPISACKSMLGHAMGASGAIETLVCALVLHHQVIPPTINLEHPDPECDLDYVPHTARPAEVNVVLKNSFGIGSQNACLVLEKYAAG